MRKCVWSWEIVLKVEKILKCSNSNDYKIITLGKFYLKHIFPQLQSSLQTSWSCWPRREENWMISYLMSNKYQFSMTMFRAALGPVCWLKQRRFKKAFKCVWGHSERLSKGHAGLIQKGKSNCQIWWINNLEKAKLPS